MSEEEKDVFCNGGMDMLMQGFETHKTAKTCIILWFPSWILNTPLKFGMACIGVFIIGFVIEFLISYRRHIASTNLEWFSNSRRSRNRLQRFITLIIFGLNLVLGYMAMLVAMTYSIELFVCLILGFCVGHFAFNTKSEVGESIDPCCASQNQRTEV